LAEFLDLNFGLSTKNHLLFTDPQILSLLLPTLSGSPVPSSQINNDLAPDVSLDLKLWKVNCCPVNVPLKSINDIHFLATYQLPDISLGQDFLFWHSFSQAIKQIISKDQFIPGLIKGKTHTFYNNWQLNFSN